MAAEIELRHVTIPDLRTILEELEAFWGEEREMAFLHQALYVHEFGETSVLAERGGRIAGYLLGFLSQDRSGYIHAAAVRAQAQGQGIGRRMYERFSELVSDREAHRLKAITAPENTGSRAFHEALGFSAEEVDGYSPSNGTRLVFLKALLEPVAGTGSEVDLGDGVTMRPMQLADAEQLHLAIEANSAHIGRWLPFADQPFEKTAAHVRRCVRDFQAGRGISMVVLDRGGLIGAVSFVDPSREHSATQIGYWLAQRAEGRGIMTRAVAAMLAEAFGPWGFKRVEIRVAADNARSRAIAERLGFREEARLRGAHTVAGATHDEVIYGLMAEDPRPG